MRNLVTGLRGEHVEACSRHFVERENAFMPLALHALAVGAFGIGVTEFVMTGLLVPIGADLGVSIAAAGLLVSGYAFGAAAGAPVLTVLCRRVPRKVVLATLMLIFTVGNAACALAPSYALLMAARVVTSLAHGTYLGVGSVVATHVVPPHKSASAVAAMFAGLTLANVLGVPGGTWLAAALGWRATFWAIAAIGVIAMLVMGLVVPATAQAPERGTVRDDLAMLGRRPVLLGLLTTVLGWAGLSVMLTYLAPLLTRMAGFSEATVSPILVVLGLGMVFGNIVGGRMADRHAMPALFGTLLSLAVVLAAMTWAVHRRMAMMPFVALLGAAGFAIAPPLQMQVLKASEGQSLASSFNIAAFNLGRAIGAWLGAMVIEHGPGLSAIPWIAALLPMAALATSFSNESLASERNRNMTTDPHASMTIPPRWIEALAREFAERQGDGRVGQVLLSETKRVRVWAIRLKPGERMPFHRHVLDYFWTAVTAGEGLARYHDGREMRVTYRAGDTKHVSFAKGEFMVHDLENVGQTELVFTTVEFLDSANAPLVVSTSPAE
ncbi:MFS transporter [Pendulispora rubella]|uniref:MFS transporter n=1 Tax=Pendulispora rubella TaxID=2741070 RepID=A0ABZ2KQ13_9BACT